VATWNGCEPNLVAQDVVLADGSSVDSAIKATKAFWKLADARGHWCPRSIEVHVNP
jgi:hypothetical protein